MIVYLHGFNSSGESAKGKRMLEYFSRQTAVFTPSYSYAPSDAIAGLQDFIQNLSIDNNEQLVIAGSSLGGFYAQYLGRIFKRSKIVMINPALGPFDTLEAYLGENTNYYSGEKYILEAKHLEQLKQLDIDSPCNDDIDTLILVDKEDEVIDYHFAVNKYQQCAKIVIYEGGDHQFQHMDEAMSEIEKFCGL